MGGILTSFFLSLYLYACIIIMCKQLKNSEGYTQNQDVDLPIPPMHATLTTTTLFVSYNIFLKQLRTFFRTFLDFVPP